MATWPDSRCPELSLSVRCRQPAAGCESTPIIAFEPRLHEPGIRDRASATPCGALCELGFQVSAFQISEFHSRLSFVRSRCFRRGERSTRKAREPHTEARVEAPVPRAHSRRSRSARAIVELALSTPSPRASSQRDVRRRKKRGGGGFARRGRWRSHPQRSGA